MSKVLIVGGSYFIGKKIVEIMIISGYEVFTLNRGTRPAPQGVTNIICDRDNKEDMQQALKNHKFSIIIDVSGLDKIQAEILLCSLDKSNLKKFVFISSSAVYDAENLVLPNETDELNGNKLWGSYGTNKIDAEKCYSQFFENTNTNLIILRPAYVYGECNYVQRESFIFEHIVHDKAIIIPTSNPKLQFIYTSDLANMIIKLLDSSLPKISVFNVGNKNALTTTQWIEYCEKTVQKQAKIIEFDYEKHNRNIKDFFPFFDYDNVLDVTKINTFCNIETDFEIGLHKSYEWYLENKNNIVFKENVAQNEKDIIKLLKYI